MNRRGRKPKHTYVDMATLINMLDNCYIIAILSYYPLKYRTKLERLVAKGADQDVIDSYNRKIDHYIKWCKYFKKIDENNYDKNINDFYTIVGVIFNKILTQFKYSNYPYEVKGDAYVTLIGQIYKYFLVSYRRYKKNLWMYYNDYEKYDELITKTKPNTIRNQFGLYDKPSNNPFSYITRCVDTSMIAAINSHHVDVESKVLFNALVNYDLNLHDYNKIKSFENDYIFDYDACDKDFDAKSEPANVLNFSDKNDDDATGLWTSHINDDVDKPSEFYFNDVTLDDIEENVEDNKVRRIDRFLVYKETLSENNRFDLYKLDEDYSNNQLIFNIIHVINKTTVNTSQCDVILLNLLFCKLVNEYNDTSGILYYIMSHTNTNKPIRRILPMLDKKIFNVLYKRFNDIFYK